MTTNLDKILDEQDPSPLGRAARRGIRLVKSERDVTNSCGCDWCDVGREPERINGRMVHVIDRRYEPCTKRARKVKNGRA